MKILQEEAKILEIVQLVGLDAVSTKDRVTLEVARLLREDYLAQDAFDDVDCYASSYKQSYMMKLIMEFREAITYAVENGVKVDDYIKLDYVSKIGKAKFVEEKNVEKEFKAIEESIKPETEKLMKGLKEE